MEHQQPSEGLLSAWLRRNAAGKIGSPSTAEPAITPTWSEASDDDANVVNTMSASPAGSSLTPPPAISLPIRPTSPVQQERVSWLTRIQGAYSNAGMLLLLLLLLFT